MTRKNAVGWFEIYVEDMERAKKFYQTVFKNELSNLQGPEGYDGEMAAFPMTEDAPNAAGALVKQKGMKPGVGGTLVYFTCEDCAVELSRVEKAGGKVLAPKFSIGEYGNIGLFADTEGNTIGVHSNK